MFIQDFQTALNKFADDTLTQPEEFFGVFDQFVAKVDESRAENEAAARKEEEERKKREHQLLLGSAKVSVRYPLQVGHQSSLFQMAENTHVLSLFMITESRSATERC